MGYNFAGGRDWSHEETPEGPRVVIPWPRLWPLTAFLAVWLAGWAAGEVSAGRQLWALLSRAEGWADLLPAGFLVFWLTGWTVGGAFAWGIFFMTLSGSEVVTLREGELRVRLETVLGLGRTWRFPVAGMAPPRVVSLWKGGAAGEYSEDGGPGPDNPVAGAAPGDPARRYAMIRIESNGRKWRLGMGLSEARAKDLLYVLTSRFSLPRPGYTRK